MAPPLQTLERGYTDLRWWLVPPQISLPSFLFLVKDSISHFQIKLWKFLAKSSTNVCVCACVHVFSHSVATNSLQLHGIYSARLLCLWDFPAWILEWVAVSFRGSSWPRNQTRVFCIGRQILYHWATREALLLCTHLLIRRLFSKLLQIVL